MVMRKLYVLWGAMVPAVAMTASCTAILGIDDDYYQVDGGYTSGGGGAGAAGDATANSASSSGSAGGEMSGGATSSSSSSGGATSSSSSSGGTNCPTDEDQDGAISSQCLGGTDCADQDLKAHPELPTVSFQSAPIQGTTAPNTQPYDFNCDGQETTETPVLDCQLKCLVGGGSGYLSTVKCGESAALGHCEIVTCAWKPDSPPQNRVQRCK
jgi:hypothetical protein